MTTDMRKLINLMELNAIETVGIEKFINLAVEELDAYFGKETTFSDLVVSYDQLYPENDFNHNYNAALLAVDEALSSSFVADLQNEGYDVRKFFKMVVSHIIEREGIDVPWHTDEYMASADKEHDLRRSDFDDF
jgi:hypothetical protein